eukprot:gene26331-17430_t
MQQLLPLPLLLLLLLLLLMVSSPRTTTRIVRDRPQAGERREPREPKVKEYPLPPSYKVISCSSSSPISIGPSFKTCGALTFTPASGSQKDSAGPKRSNHGTGCTEHLSMLLHVLKAGADAGSIANSSTSGSPIHSHLCSASALAHLGFPHGNTHTSQSEPPHNPRTSELITLGFGACMVHLAPILCSTPQGESTGCGKAICEILSLVMGRDKGFSKLLLHQSLHAVMAFENSFPPGISHPYHFVTPTYVIEPATGFLLPSLLVELDTSCLPPEAATTIELLCKAQVQASLGLASFQEVNKGLSSTEVEPSVLTAKSANSEQLTECYLLSQTPAKPLTTHTCVGSLPPCRIPNENIEVTGMDVVPSISNPIPLRLNKEQPDLQASSEGTLPSDTENTLPRDTGNSPPSKSKLPCSQESQGRESNVQFSQSGCLIPDIDPMRGLYVSGCIFVQSADPDGSSSPMSNSDLPILYQTSASYAHVADQAESDCSPVYSQLFYDASEPFFTDQEETMNTITDLCWTQTMSATHLKMPTEIDSTSLHNDTAHTRDLEFCSSSMRKSSQLSSLRKSNLRVQVPASRFEYTSWESIKQASESAPEFQSAVRRSINPAQGSSPTHCSYSAPPATGLLATTGEVFDLLCPYQAGKGALGAVDALPKGPDAVPSSFAPPAHDVIAMFRPLQPAARTPLSPRPGMGGTPTNFLPPKSYSLVPAERQAHVNPSVVPFQSKEFGVLARGCTVLDSIPIMATLLDWSGSRVLYQKQAVSRGKKGERAQILEDLSKSQEVLDSLLIDVRNGKECRLLAHMPRPQPPDPSSSLIHLSSPCVRPVQYPLSGGQLTAEHSVSPLAHTEAQAQVPAGYYSRSQEGGTLQPLSRLSTGKRGLSCGTPFSACNLEFTTSRGMSRNVSRSSLHVYGHSCNLSGMLTPERSCPNVNPSSPRSLLAVSLSQKVVTLLHARSSFHNACSSEQGAQRRNSHQNVSSELMSFSRTNSGRVSSTKSTLINSVRRTNSSLGPYASNNPTLPDDMSAGPPSASSLGTAVLTPGSVYMPSNTLATHGLYLLQQPPQNMQHGMQQIASSDSNGQAMPFLFVPNLASSDGVPEYPGTAICRGSFSSEIEASHAPSRGNLTISAGRMTGSSGPLTHVRSMALANKQKQRLPRRQSDRNLEGMGKEAANKPELSFHHSDQMQTFCSMNSRVSMKLGGEMRSVGRMSWPAVILESSGSNIQGMVDEDSRMSHFQDTGDEDFGMGPRSSFNSGTDKHYSGTEKHYSGSSPAPDAILLLQTDITERADLEARIADLAEAQTDMLASMFPRHVLEHMVGMQDSETPNLSELARSHEDITVRFIDVVGFTSMSNEVPSQSVMAFLSQFFTVMDRPLDDFNVYKVDTCGDCYIVAGGLMERSSGDGELVLAGDMDPKEGAQQVMEYIAAVVLALTDIRYPHNGKPASFRVGVHTGSCVTGVIGTKLPKFSLWGDTMNTASRMESTSQPGLVQVSNTTFNLLDPSLKSQFTTMEGVEIKGMMETYVMSVEDLIKGHRASISLSCAADLKSSRLSPMGKGMMKTHVLSMEDLIKGHRASILRSGTADCKSTSSRLSPIMSLRRSQSLFRQICRLGKTTTGASDSMRVCKDYNDSKAKATKKGLMAQLVDIYKASSSTSST